MKPWAVHGVGKWERGPTWVPEALKVQGLEA